MGFSIAKYSGCKSFKLFAIDFHLFGKIRRLCINQRQSICLDEIGTHPNWICDIYSLLHNDAILNVFFPSFSLFLFSVALLQTHAHFVANRRCTYTRCVCKQFTIHAHRSRIHIGIRSAVSRSVKSVQKIILPKSDYFSGTLRQLNSFKINWNKCIRSIWHILIVYKRWKCLFDVQWITTAALSFEFERAKRTSEFTIRVFLLFFLHLLDGAK